MPKKMAPVSGKRCLSDVSAPESGTRSIITQNSKNERRKMKPKTFVFYVKETSLSPEYICNPWNIYYRMKDLAKADQETFWVIGYNNQLQEIYNECLFIGGISKCDVDNKILFKRLLMAGASRFIIVHNHPGGKCKPSEYDKRLTDKIKEGSEILDLELLDHIIIADDNYYSFKKDY